MTAMKGILSALFASLLLVSLPEPLRGEDAADAFDCAICHPMKIRDFKSRRGTPIVALKQSPEEPTGVQDIASTSGMCLSCHDGFVEDSRDIWIGGYRGHRLGMAPSDHVTLPTLGDEPVFPMNADGKMYCGTCHTAHRSEQEGAPAKVDVFMRASNNGAKWFCQACHEDQAQIKGSSHDRSSRRAKDFESRGKCGKCHAPHGSDLPLMWARDWGEGNITVNTFCRSCHDDGPDPAEHPAEVVAWSQEVRNLVRGHSPAEMPVFDELSHQARVGSIGCPTCHNPHRERAAGRPEHLPGLFLRMPEFVEPLCADCHGKESIFLYKFFHSPASR